MSIKIILVRHADYDGDGANPGLSTLGKKQSNCLANKVEIAVRHQEFEIWSSPANRAKETAEIISQKLNHPEVIFKDKLWSDKDHRYDFRWLKDELSTFDNKVIVIVTHLEYVQFFPEKLGYPCNEAGYAEGVYIRGLHDDGGILSII